MKSLRINSILLCQAHLAQFHEVTELVWKEVIGTSLDYEQLRMFLIVRLYAEAGQLDDLQLMIAQLENRTNAIHKTASAMSNAIDNAKKKDAPIHIQALESENTPPVLKHVARWSLIRNPKQSVPALKAAALKTQSRSGDFFQILAAIDSLGSRTALIDLASNRDAHRMQVACSAIRHLKDRKELLAKVIARVPEQNRNRIDLDIEREPLPREYRYYESWTPPKSKSLPKLLPEKLLDE